ncbi:hypothetical protein BDZ91DRAFT_548142 [Kalaharituber pfeilii]|nr:hypothetical protein BDZ91DRAFT_548142 [Kalaharituber pfeilii]
MWSRPLTIICSLLCWASSFHGASSQKPLPEGSINFQNYKHWLELKGCLQDCFYSVYCTSSFQCNGTVGYYVRCKADVCICDPKTVPEALEWAGDCAAVNCQNEGFRSQAEDTLIGYCDQMGYPPMNKTSPTAMTVR